jgi:hypothetical protein
MAGMSHYNCEHIIITYLKNHFVATNISALNVKHRQKYVRLLRILYIVNGISENY